MEQGKIGYYLETKLLYLSYKVQTGVIAGMMVALGVGIVRFKTIPVLFEYLWNDSDF